MLGEPTTAPLPKQVDKCATTPMEIAFANTDELTPTILWLAKVEFNIETNDVPLAKTTFVISVPTPTPLDVPTYPALENATDTAFDKEIHKGVLLKPTNPVLTKALS